MKNRHSLILSTLLLLLLASCSEKETRIVDFLVEFATVAKTASSTTIVLDNGTVLTPNNAINGEINVDIKDGDRVILNYTPLEDGFISINSIRRILLANILEEGYPAKRKTSPIKIVSVWVSGKYLNMSFYVDYHSKPHTAALFRDMQAGKPTLYFSYSRGEDPPGAPTLTYLSFNIESLQKKNFTIYINTDEGERKFELK